MSEKVLVSADVDWSVRYVALLLQQGGALWVPLRHLDVASASG